MWWWWWRWWWWWGAMQFWQSPMCNHVPTLDLILVFFYQIASSAPCSGKCFHQIPSCLTCYAHIMYEQWAFIQKNKKAKYSIGKLFGDWSWRNISVSVEKYIGNILVILNIFLNIWRKEVTPSEGKSEYWFVICILIFWYFRKSRPFRSLTIEWGAVQNTFWILNSEWGRIAEYLLNSALTKSDFDPVLQRLLCIS